MEDTTGRGGHELEIGTVNAQARHPTPHLAPPAMRHRRRNPGDLEIGDTQVLQKHPTPHLAIEHAPPVPAWRLRLEERRPTWLREMIAEATGVFCYVYCGGAANCAFFLTQADKLPQYGNLLTVGFGYGFGIAFALITSATTSGGHFNPAVTLGFAIFNGFPWTKVPRYILSQITGGFVATLCIYGQYYQQLHAYEAATVAAGGEIISAMGPAGIFVAVPLPTQGLGAVFINEFIADFFIGLVIIAVLDKNNGFMGPTAAPWAIGLAYTTMIWGFAVGTISTNTARDLGARFAAACFYGTGVFTIRKSYVAISALTNIPATLCAWTFYHLNVTDSGRLIDAGHATHPEVYKTLTRDREAANALDGLNGSPTNAKTAFADPKGGAEIYHSDYAGDR